MSMAISGGTIIQDNLSALAPGKMLNGVQIEIYTICLGLSPYYFRKESFFAGKVYPVARFKVFSSFPLRGGLPMPARTLSKSK
jgi:hypothetical protein